MSVDTLTIARNLKAAELPPEQAEAIAAAIGQSITEGSATKSDLQLLGQEVRAEIAQLRAEMKANVEQLRAEMKANVEQLRAEMERMRNQLLLGFVSSQIALAGVIIAVIKL